MKNIVKNSPLSIAIAILGIGILVAGILIMALYHDMSWQSYVVIGVLMLCSIAAIFNVPLGLVPDRKRVNEIRDHRM